jgi:tetratricopeptide (TPR) repeat protein
MLFDLSSPGRKTAVRIIFGFLAFIFATGFVFLGIGTEGGFNPFDSAGGGSTDEALEQQIEDAEEAVAAAPDDPEPLASLIVIRGQSGTRQLEVDEETGQPIALTDNSRAEYEEAISLWQEYLELEPRKVNAAAAGAVVQAYRFLGDARGAIAAQRALVKSDPRSPNFVALAFLLYTDFQIEAADKARDQAIAKADGDTKKQLTQEFEQIRKQAIKAEEQQKKQPETETGESPELSDPFGGLSPTDPATQAP